MSGDDTAPDFNWLKQGADRQKPNAPVPPISFIPPDPVPPETPPPAVPETAGNEQPETEEPAVEAEITPESPLVQETDDVELNPGEPESLVADESRPLQSGDSLAEASPVETSSEHSASDHAETSLSPAASDPSESEESGSPIDAAGTEESEGEFESHIEELPGEDSPVLEEMPFVMSESNPADDRPADEPTKFESDTDVSVSGLTSEVEKIGRNWPDFAIGPAAAAATMSGFGEKRPSKSPFAEGGEPLPPSFSTVTTSSPKPKGAAGKTDPPAGGISKRLFFIVASYASVITLAFLLMLIKELTSAFSPHRLESLPDIPNQKIENLTYVPANSTLPPGHAVNFGVARRFGNILVEPVKITQEPAEFVHYTGDAKRQREATPPVWKLWLKLTNVSQDQTIAPLDRKLVLRWISKAKQPIDVTNYYITESGTRNRAAPTVQLYRLPVASDWDLKGQDLGKELKPGESVVTYLASSDEGLESLGDHLVWRVQIRKGYSSHGTGVTTIFEVPFHKADVLLPSASPSQAS